MTPPDIGAFARSLRVGSQNIRRGEGVHLFDLRAIATTFAELGLDDRHGGEL